MYTHTIQTPEGEKDILLARRFRSAPTLELECAAEALKRSLGTPMEVEDFDRIVREIAHRRDPEAVPMRDDAYYDELGTNGHTNWYTRMTWARKSLRLAGRADFDGLGRWFSTEDLPKPQRTIAEILAALRAEREAHEHARVELTKTMTAERRRHDEALDAFEEELAEHAS